MVPAKRMMTNPGAHGCPRMTGFGGIPPRAAPTRLCPLGHRAAPWVGGWSAQRRGPGSSGSFPGLSGPLFVEACLLPQEQSTNPRPYL